MPADRKCFEIFGGYAMRKSKYILVTFSNYILVLCAYLFYRGGALTVWSLCIMLQIVLTILNYKTANGSKSLAVLCANHLLSTIIANKLSTNLYYNNISSDGLTLAVGDLGLIVGSVFVFILSLISIFLKKRKSK